MLWPLVPVFVTVDCFSFQPPWWRWEKGIYCWFHKHIQAAFSAVSFGWKGVRRNDLAQTKLCQGLHQKVEIVGIVFRASRKFWKIEVTTRVISHFKSQNVFGKISALPLTTLCIQFSDRKNNDKNNTLPLGKQICFTIVWGCAEILPCFSTEILKNILKRSCPFEFLFKQFYSVLLSSCSLLRFLLLLGHSFDLSP